ncbi:MAG: hypothetical protein OEV74_21960 [Cyclobacteriaceae bacterium]|nr:hypothetical protein [Cyclobacteriaceae bacterium]
MKANIYLKSALGAALLTIAYWVANLVLMLPNDPGSIAWSLFSNYLVALVLGYLIMHSRSDGIKLMMITFIILFLIGHFNILVEALIFNVTDREETIREIIRGFLVATVFSPVYVYLSGPKPNPGTPRFAARSFISWTWRVILGDVLYLLLYLIAGLTLTRVYPEILQFYEGKIPPFDVMIKTQLFLRGFIFIGIAVIILRTLSVGQIKKAIFIGLVFAVLGGIAPLLPPNALMPGYVRLGHGFEVGISNFLYGFILSYLLAQKPDANISGLSKSPIPVQG